MIIKVNPDKPQKRLIALAAKVLREDGVIVYPTDTVYGIGCDIFSKSGIEKICRIKKRDKKKPLSFICQNLSEVSKYVRLTDFAYRVMKDTLPGPFTFILEATKAVPKLLQAKRRTVGIRIPDSEICLEIIKEFGAPITSTSANISGCPEFRDVYDIEAAFDNQIGLYIDGGRLVSEPSTVISLVDDEIEILRQGKGEINF
jgi:tRNA threonylcarbamoyl adenosine modification protein (Sua5/YciO/YrdC/YwlC family)